MILAGDEVHGDEVTSGTAPDRSCEPCAECGVACAKTDEGLCWECSQDVGGEG